MPYPLLTLMTTMALAAGAAGASAQWSLSVRTVHHADAVPLSAIGDEDAALRSLDPRPGRNLAYVDDELRASRSDGAWRWSVLTRSSGTLVTSKDTLDLTKQVNSDIAPTQDRRWQTTVRYESFQGGGLELARALAPAPHWRAALSAQALQLRHWRARRLDGPVSFDAASATYTFDLQSTQTDDRLRFPFQTAYAGGGAGLLLGGELGWRDEAWSATLSVRDRGWLRWRGLPQQRATLSTQTQSYDADGFVIYRPLIVGQNSQQGYTHRMHGWWTLRANWRVDASSQFELASDWVPGFGALPAIGWQQRVTGDAALGLQWRFHERRASVSLGWRGWQLSAGTDHLSSGARSRELALSGNLPF